MNKSQKQPAIIPSIFCGIFGHRYNVSKNITYHVKEYKCCNCNKELTTNENGNLIELTPKYREINAILARVHSKRQARIRREELLTSYKLSS